jgi:hypothetical protein
MDLQGYTDGEKKLTPSLPMLCITKKQQGQLYKARMPSMHVLSQWCCMC